MLAAPLVPARAQMSAPHRAQRPHPAIALGLTPAQNAKLNTLSVEASRRMMAVNANQSLPPAVRTAKMRAIAQNSTTQMMALLTPAQRAKTKAMMQQAQAKGWQQDEAYRYRFEDLSSPKTRHF